MMRSRGLTMTSKRARQTKAAGSSGQATSRAKAGTKTSQAGAAPAPTGKPKVGFYGITGCAGCLLSFIFNEDEILDLVNAVDLKAFPFIKEVNPDEQFDFIFLEGLVADAEDLEVAKKLRANAKVLVALGACACTGCVPAYRQFSLKENYEHLLYRKEAHLQDVKPTPVDEHIKVDFYIPGCPPDKQQIINFIKQALLGKAPPAYTSPVCVECRRNGNACLLDQGKPCLGPITVGGCHAVCINGGMECWGCRGPTTDMNLGLMIKILREKGFDDKFIQDRMRTFVGLKLPMLERVIHGEHNT
ncbi:NADH:ubiquinone oxidoreductase [Candidatus Woesearchaeota archaeon CG11_big_fil_rev_8_21_14_0_20_57_5]|nr:MAG: NADH:ubiquinone oxidoreductase [Candidatus Woesearchaeota archaeon CG11_big_fil_rev_8_21_14_0_20_57_5]